MFRNICKVAIRSYSTFKKPPPYAGYKFKRPVVPSDFEAPKFTESKFDCENEKWTGKELYSPKYGNSHYEYSNKQVSTSSSISQDEKDKLYLGFLSSKIWNKEKK